MPLIWKGINPFKAKINLLYVKRFSSYQTTHFATIREAIS